MIDRPGLEEDMIGPSGAEEGALARPPHKVPATPREWVKENLFSTPFNSSLTIVFGLLGMFVAYQVLKFVFVTGEWAVFQNNAHSYMTGRFPLGEMWRLWVCVYGVAFLAGLSRGMLGLTSRPSRRQWIVTGVMGAFGVFVFASVVDTALLWILTLAVGGLIVAGSYAGRVAGPRLLKPVIAAWLLAFPLMMILIRGFGGVPPRLWGGFMLNLVVATVAIFVSFPIGLLLALGRRSSLPVVRWFSLAVIELVRGNPLYILLTAGAFLLPLLLPPGMSDIPLIIRAMAIFVIFSSAYVAEIVRGGLQGVDAGQYEASKALGLSTTRMMALVILPQALRATIPAMISHFISLFKDTSLLAIIGGFTDALRSARRASAGLGEAGNSLEALLPAAMLFFIVAFAMARWSQRVEKRLGVGER